MATVFYDHLIDWESLEKALAMLELDREIQHQYLDEIEHTVHTEVLTVITEHLPEEHHEDFLERFHAAPHDPSHLHYIVSHGHPDVELAIQAKANQVIAEIIVELEVT